MQNGSVKIKKGEINMPRKKLTEAEELERVLNMYEIENEYHKNGYVNIAGIDEAGRGPLAGPVYAAAVILDSGTVIKGLNDSKKLSEKRREEIFDEIIEKAVSYNIFSVDEKVIDEINILEATYKAMGGAVEGLEVVPDFVLIDGNRIKGIELPHETVVKGDLKCASIAAASILAKVSRDRFMIKAAGKYSQYGFEKHKGYGTAAHNEAILKYGPCPIHRRTFLRKLLGE